MISAVLHNVSQVGKIVPNSLAMPHSYHLFFNRVTGEMRFLDKSRLSSAWKSAQLIVTTGPAKMSFHLCDDLGQPLQRTGLKMAAWKVACEMLAVLNGRGPLSEEVLAQQSSIEELPGWSGKINRITAEKKLGKAPLGAYHIREGDKLTDAIAKELSDANQMLLVIYLITYVAEGGKIIDVCILQTERGWTIYQDNPNLSQYPFTFSPKELFYRLPLRHA